MKIDDQLAVIRDPQFLDDVRASAKKVLQFNIDNNVQVEDGFLSFPIHGVKVRVQSGQGMNDAIVEAGVDREDDQPGNPLYQWRVPVTWLLPNPKSS